MERSEEESGWKRSSNSWRINLRKAKIAPSEEEDHAPGSCTDEIDRHVGYSPDRHDEGGEISLRLWLDRPDRSVDLIECLHIFRQVVDMVSIAHSQGISVSNVRPSCFVMSTFNRVSFIESASCSSSGSESEEKDDPCTTSRDQNSENSCGEIADKKKSFPLKRVLLLEYNRYTSPEESTGVSGSFASDIYKLGVLLFEVRNWFSFSFHTQNRIISMFVMRTAVLSDELLRGEIKDDV